MYGLILGQDRTDQWSTDLFIQCHLIRYHQMLLVVLIALQGDAISINRNAGALPTLIYIRTAEHVHVRSTPLQEIL